MAEQQYANYEDKLLNDTIRFENGNFVWGSNSEIIPENEIDDVLAALSANREMQNAINSLSNLDTKENKAYTDSLKNIINSTTVEDIERMTESELIEFNKTYDRLKGIDTTYQKIGKLDLGTNYLDQRLSAQESAALVDNLRVINNLQTASSPTYGSTYGEIKDELSGLLDAIALDETPWLENGDRTITTFAGADDKQDFQRDFSDLTNTFGLGPELGKDIGTGVHRIVSFLDYYLNPFD